MGAAIPRPEGLYRQRNRAGSFSVRFRKPLKISALNWPHFGAKNIFTFFQRLRKCDD
jgi:hypothetical protein